MSFIVRIFYLQNEGFFFNDFLKTNKYIIKALNCELAQWPIFILCMPFNVFYFFNAHNFKTCFNCIIMYLNVLYFVFITYHILHACRNNFKLLIQLCTNWHCINNTFLWNRHKTYLLSCMLLERNQNIIDKKAYGSHKIV